MSHQPITIGKTNVTATRLGLGTNAVGGYNLFPDLKDETGLEIVKAGLEHGITLLDTAYVYGLGHSEELVGQAIKSFDREKITLATKGAHDFSSGQEVINNDPQFLIKQVDAVDALQKLRKQGKIKAIGLSNFSLAQIKEANTDGYVDVVEDEFSLLHQDHAVEMMPYLKENQISFIPYFPLASGLLTGKYDQNVKFSDDDIRSQIADFQEPRYSKALAAVEQVRPIARDHHATVAQIILAWYMKNPLISVVIPGAKKPDQVIANAKAMRITLNDSEYETIDTAFADFKKVKSGKSLADPE